jgi:hypothetical protein
VKTKSTILAFGNTKTVPFYFNPINKNNDGALTNMNASTLSNLRHKILMYINAK